VLRASEELIMSKGRFGAGALSLVALTSAAATAAAFYFAGPGARRRRARALDRVHHLEKLAAVGADKAKRDLAQRAQGVAARRRASDDLGVVDDGVLIARVRSAIGHVCSHPHAVTVEADDKGGVTLRGDVLADERARIARAASKVRGVRAVRDELAGHDADKAASIPALQGGKSRARAPELTQRSWAPGPRLVAGATGGALAAGALVAGVTPRSFFARIAASLAALFGVGVLARAGSNRRFTDWSGPFTVKKSIAIRASADEVFSIFGHPESFPLFMTHVRDVQKLDDEEYVWRVDGPLGPLSSTCEIMRWMPGDSIAWRSFDGRMHGEIRFTPVSEGTRVDCEVTGSRGAGGAMLLLGKLIGRDVKRYLDDDLLRLKSLIENKKATGKRGSIGIDDVLTGHA
jgi:uncharacterized membrane protein